MSHQEQSSETAQEKVVITATPVHVRRPPASSTASFNAPSSANGALSASAQQSEHMLIDSSVAEAALATIATDPAFNESSAQISSSLRVHDAERALAQAVQASQPVPLQPQQLQLLQQQQQQHQQQQHRQQQQNELASSARLCNRCKSRKPDASFVKPPGREGYYKFCESCREQSRQHTSDTRKRKRESEIAGVATSVLGGGNSVTGGSVIAASDATENNGGGMGSGSGADPYIIKDYADLVRLFPTPGRAIDDDHTITVDPEITGGLTHVPLHQKSFILQSSVSLDGGLTTIDDMLKGISGEPTELFKTVIQRIYDISGYYFARRARTKSPKSYRIQYVCSQVADTSNNRNPFKPAKRARARRELYNCHGRLILAASYVDHSVVIKYTHQIVHGPATRRRYLSDEVKAHILRNRDKPLSEIFSSIRELGPEAGTESELASVTRKQVYIFLKRYDEAERNGRELSNVGPEDDRYQRELPENGKEGEHDATQQYTGADLIFDSISGAT
ncbi:uncharacterized protein V2V93DRAFT_368339 [Kockiozyma suomiensis]|uniref:uncharacterized protein n=1 Tax=Kockiozyma suomiensis TaxID=1337062 RepID=UPI003343B776